jgi:hypothetical protein
MKTHHHTTRASNTISNTISAIATGLALLAAASHAAAAADSPTIFAFGPATDYVTADKPLGRNPAAVTGSGEENDPYVHTISFDDAAALGPASDYTGPQFYGGYTFTSSSVQGKAPAGRVLNNWSLIGNNDAIRIYADAGDGNNWNGSTLGFAAAFIFKQADFIAGKTTGNFAPDGFSVTWRASSGANGNLVPAGRWIVQVDGNYYLSEATITAAGYNITATASLTGSELTNTKWAAYNPAASLNFDQDAASFTALELTAVTAIGVYFEHDSYAATANDRSGGLLALSTFAATGAITAIPEPGAMAALAGLATLAAVCAVRRRK